MQCRCKLQNLCECEYKNAKVLRIKMVFLGGWPSIVSKDSRAPSSMTEFGKEFHFLVSY